MQVEQIRKCLEHGLEVFWANGGYTCSIDGDRMLVTWNKGGRGEHCVGLEGNHDLSKFFPNPMQICFTSDPEGLGIRGAREALYQPATFVKFQNKGEDVWIAVLDPAAVCPPDVEEATEAAIKRLEAIGGYDQAIINGPLVVIN